MTIYLASDHAGFAYKEALREFVQNELGYVVVDCGAYEENMEDDYPDFVRSAAEAVSEDAENRKAIILGGSGQGEAICANRHPGVRAVVYYGEPTHDQVDADGVSRDIITSSRNHNDANVLSIGARFVSLEEAKRVVALWLETPFGRDARHVRRIEKLG